MKLPVVEIAAEAFHAVWRHRRTLADRAAVPLAIVLGIGILEHLIANGEPVLEPPPGVGTGEDGPEGGEATGGGGPGLIGFAYLVASLPFLVSWYRLIIDGPQALAGRPPFSFGRPEWRMLLWAMALGLVLAVPMVIAGAVAIPFATGDLPAGQVPLMPVLLAVFFFILLVLASLRLSLIFPAIAVEEPASFQRAWDMSKGNSLRLLGLALVIHVPALMFGGLLELTVIGFGVPFSVMLAVDLAVSFAVMALGATMFAEVYKRLR